jgi:hypothetical protein
MRVEATVGSRVNLNGVFEVTVLRGPICVDGVAAMYGQSFFKLGGASFSENVLKDRDSTACGARKPSCGYAAWAYSLIRPPRIGRRSSRPASIWRAGDRGAFGGCWPSVRCGRWLL